MRGVNWSEVREWATAAGTVAAGIAAWLAARQSRKAVREMKADRLAEHQQRARADLRAIHGELTELKAADYHSPTLPGGVYDIKRSVSHLVRVSEFDLPTCRQIGDAGDDQAEFRHLIPEAIAEVEEALRATAEPK